MTDAPFHLMGWNPSLATDSDREAIASLPFPGPPVVAAEEFYEPPWLAIKAANDGRHLETFLQQTGDCVAAGLSHVARYMLAIFGIEQCMKDLPPQPHVSWIYGVARCTHGDGRLRQPGATGLWGALTWLKDGLAFETDAKIPPYSGELSNRWGRPPGPPRTWHEDAALRKALRVERIRTIADLRNALIENHLVTIASQQGFQMKPRSISGFHVFQPSGSWSHQMALIGWRDEPFAAAYRLNSWGPAAHGEPLNGEPPGGAWNLAEHLQKELTSPYTEAYAFTLAD